MPDTSPVGYPNKITDTVVVEVPVERLAVPSGFTASGNPITNSGTITISANSQSANMVYASPTNSPGTPVFRLLSGEDLSSAVENGTNSVVTVDPTSGRMRINIPIIGGGTGAVYAGGIIVTNISADTGIAITNIDGNLQISVPINSLALDRLENAPADSLVIGRRSGSAGEWEFLTLGSTTNIVLSVTTNAEVIATFIPTGVGTLDGTNDWTALNTFSNATFLLLSVDQFFAGSLTVSNTMTLGGTDITAVITNHAVNAVNGQSFADYAIFPAASMTPASTNGCAAGEFEPPGANALSKDTMDCDDTTDEAVFYSLPMPPNWVTNTPFQVRFAWTTSATSNQVAWGFSAAAASHNDSYTNLTFGTEVMVTNAVVGASDRHVFVTGDITPANSPVQGDEIIFKTRRNASVASDAPGDARIIEATVRYFRSLTNSVGWN